MDRPTDASGNLLPRALATAKPKPPVKPAWLDDPATTAPIAAHSGRPADSSGRNRKQPAAYVPVKDAPRRWGSRTGRHTLAGGQLIGMAGNGQVVIRRPDGKTTSPHISDLSDDDVAYLQQVRQQQIPDSVFPEVAPVQQNAFAQAGRDMSARNRRQLDAKTDRLGRQFAAADKRMAEEKRRMQAGMRPEIVSEQEHAMFGLPPDAPDAAAGGPTPAMQQRMQMTDRNRERDAQAQAIGRVIRRSQQVNDGQRRAIAQRYGVDPQVAGGWENMQDVHDFEMGVRRSDRRRAYAIRGITDRYSPELAAQGVGVADLEKIYDEAEAAMPGSGPAALNNHGRAGRIALQGVRDGQARNNIRANAADDALSRGLMAGRGPGIVARGAANARTPAERAATAAIAETQGMDRVAEAMVAPEQAPANPAEVPWADLGAIWTHLQTLPPEARAAEAQMIMPNANPDWVKSWVDQRNRAAGQGPPSNGWMRDVLRFLFPPPARRDVPGMGTGASNPAAAATGYLDPRSVAAGRNAGSLLTGFMG